MTATLTADEQYLDGRARRHGTVVCERIAVYRIDDQRTGVTPTERRHVTVRFLDGDRTAGRAMKGPGTRRLGQGARRSMKAKRAAGADVGSVGRVEGETTKVRSAVPASAFAPVLGAARRVAGHGQARTPPGERHLTTGRPNPLPFRQGDVVLALFAHPDDAELACFGTLALLRSCGCAIYCHTVTLGEATSNGSCAVDGLRRARESVAAAELVDAVASWDSLPDGRVTPSAPTVDAIERRVRSLAPTVVITHHPNDPGHQDHRTVGRAAAQVALKADSVRCVLLAEPPTPAQDFAPNLLVDVTEYYEIKRRAVAAHRSESTKAFVRDEVLDARARWWALHAGTRALGAGRRFEASRCHA